MKITIIQGAFFPVPTLMGGAVEKIWFRLGQAFAAQGHTVTHISRRHPRLLATEIIKGVKHVRVRGYDQPSSLLKLKLLDFAYSWGACKAVPPDSDIVVTNTFWAPLLLPKALRGRAYVDIQRMPKGQCRLYKHAARLRANSTAVARAICLELPADQHARVHTIPNPLPFAPPVEVDLGAKRNQVLFCGRVHPEKGLDLLMKAAASLPEGWTVEILGPWETGQGGGGKAYLEHLQTLASNAPVTFHGPEFDMERLSGHYRQAAIFAYPSVADQGETFGLAPLEAMAWGCVPVASNLACFKDFILHDKNGLIFDHHGPQAVQDLAAAVQTLIDNADMRQRFAQEAMRVAAEHAPNRIADAFVTDFRTVAGPR